MVGLTLGSSSILCLRIARRLLAGRGLVGGHHFPLGDGVALEDIQQFGEWSVGTHFDQLIEGEDLEVVTMNAVTLGRARPEPAVVAIVVAALDDRMGRVLTCRFEQHQCVGGGDARRNPFQIA